jgi:hypothetical protein
MINVRIGTFETNSSSTHSLVVMTKSQYAKWAEDERNCLKLSNECFYPPEEVQILTYEDIVEKYKQIFPDREVTEERVNNFASRNYLPFYDHDYGIEGEFGDYKIISIYLND